MLLKNKKGITLIEMMATVVIMSMVVVASVRIINSINGDAKEMHQEVNEKRTFITATSQLLEEIKYANNVILKEENEVQTLTYTNKKGEVVSYIINERVFFEVRNGVRKKIAEIKPTTTKKIYKNEEIISFNMEIKNLDINFKTKVVLRNEK